ncbi:MAG: U32 family peptidase [Spirochaetaceae bacterium]|nr:U32 family peptidase [Spirochaetaceae bacterium]
MTELLAPAGSIEALNAAIANGADACYLGLKDFNARLRGTNFAYNQLEAACAAANKQGKKIYVTVNTLVCEDELDRVASLLAFLKNIGAGAVIVQDLGVASLVKEYGLPLHISTQAAAASHLAVNFFKDYGATRIVLARELTLTEIAHIKNNTEAEIEVFCHGSLCSAYSGLCLFSSYLGGASANRGSCTQPCRRQYNSKQDKASFFSPRDLQAIHLIPQLVKIGVSSLKIEGRMKSSGYVATVTKAYRYVLDNLNDSERAIAYAGELLQSDFARSKTTFFLEVRENTDFLKISGATGLFLGQVAQKGSQFYLPNIKLEAGDYLRINSPDDSKRLNLKIKEPLFNEEGFVLEHNELAAGDLVYLSSRREQSYPPFIPNNLAPYINKPPKTKARAAKPSKEKLKILPKGNYILTANLNNLSQLVSYKPAMLWLELNRSMAKTLRAAKNLPVKKNMLAIYLEPVTAEEQLGTMVVVIEELVRQGFTNFVANNTAHFGLLAKHKVNIIAGPWLYVHNRLAAELLFAQKAAAITFPFEASLKNSLAVTHSYNGDSFIMPLFGRPELFMLRVNLQSVYKFNHFSEASDGDSYSITANGEGSKVFPHKAYSILQHKNSLTKAGINRFLYDLRELKDGKELDVVFKEHKKPLNNTKAFNFERGFLN